MGDLIPASLAGVTPCTLRIFRRYWRGCVLLALLLEGPAYLLIEAIGRPDLGPGAGGSEVDVLVCSLVRSAVPSLASSVLSGLLYVVLTAAIAAHVLLRSVGGGRGPWQALSVTMGRLRPLANGALLAVLLVALMVGLPLAALGFIQGCYGAAGGDMAAVLRQVADEVRQSAVARGVVWLSLLLGVSYLVRVGVTWVVMPQAALLEGGSAPALLWRSRELVQDRWLGVAGTLLLLLIVQQVAAWIVWAPLTFVSYAVTGPVGDALRAGIRIITQAGAVPIGSIGATVLYLYLRRARDAASDSVLEADVRHLAAHD